MINKLYDTIKKFIKENYKQILILIALYILMTFPLPYYICISGGTIDINDRVTIEDSYDSKGSFNLAYVSEIRATPPTLLLSYIIPNWERINISNYKSNENESIKEVTTRDKLYLEEGNLNALKVAYEAANKKLDIKNNKYYIVYVDDKVTADIKVGDVLISADGIKIKDIDDYKKLVESKDYGTKIELEINRDEKIIKTEIEVQKIDNKKLTGISIVNLFEYNAIPDIEFNFDKKESGSSGGLMLTLSIYDKLISDDITKGLKIVGTGTIDREGNVGEIGGVKYKLMGAIKDKADVFIAPKGKNYDDCIKLKNEKNYNIKILEVETFTEAIQKIKDL